jgi:hypothetical protein
MILFFTLKNYLKQNPIVRWVFNLIARQIDFKYFADYFSDSLVPIEIKKQYFLS